MNFLDNFLEFLVRQPKQVYLLDLVFFLANLLSGTQISKEPRLSINLVFLSIVEV